MAVPAGVYLHRPVGAGLTVGEQNLAELVRLEDAQALGVPENLEGHIGHEGHGAPLILGDPQSGQLLIDDGGAGFLSGHYGHGLHRVRDPQSGDGAGEGDPGAGADPGASGAGGPEKGRKVVFQGDHPDKCGEVGGGPDHESRTLRREGR